MASHRKSKAPARPVESRPVAPLYRHIQELRRLAERAKALRDEQPPGADPWIDQSDVAQLEIMADDLDYRLALAVLSVAPDRCDPAPVAPTIRAYREDGLIFRAVLLSPQPPEPRPVLVLAECCRIEVAEDVAGKREKQQSMIEAARRAGTIGGGHHQTVDHLAALAVQVAAHEAEAQEPVQVVRVIYRD